MVSFGVVHFTYPKGWQSNYLVNGSKFLTFATLWVAAEALVDSVGEQVIFHWTIPHLCILVLVKGYLQFKMNIYGPWPGIGLAGESPACTSPARTIPCLSPGLHSLKGWLFHLSLLAWLLEMVLSSWGAPPGLALLEETDTFRLGMSFSQGTAPCFEALSSTITCVVPLISDLPQPHCAGHLICAHSRSHSQLALYYFWSPSLYYCLWYRVIAEKNVI